MITDDQLETITLLLYEIDAVQIGQYTLQSGRISPIYIDLRLLASYPTVLRQAAVTYRSLLKAVRFDLLAATPLAGLPIGTALCLEMNLPLIYPRESPKNLGIGKRIEGRWKTGQTAVVVDDLISSGDRLLQTISLLEEEGLVIKDAVVLIDREQGAEENLRERGYALHSAMTIGQLLDILVKNERISEQQRGEVMAAQDSDR